MSAGSIGSSAALETSPVISGVLAESDRVALYGTRPAPG